MTLGENIIRLVQQKGPCVPAELSSDLGENPIIVSAVMKDLSTSRQLLETYAKWGSSPLFYLPHQIEQIQRLYAKMSERDQHAFDSLKTSKVLRDSELPQITHNGLRAIRDFAVALPVITPTGEKELFWKWYLVQNEEAAQLIRTILVPHDVENQATITLLDPSSAPKKRGKKQKVPTFSQSQDQLSLAQVITLDQSTKGTVDTAKTTPSEALQRPKFTVLVAPPPVVDVFAATVTSAFEKKSIKIISSTVIRKNAEVDFVVLLPTPAGELKSFVKARNKKKSNEEDVSATVLKALQLQLPAIYVSCGDLTKKSEDIVKKNIPSALVMKI